MNMHIIRRSIMEEKIEAIEDLLTNKWNGDKKQASANNVLRLASILLESHICSQRGALFYLTAPWYNRITRVRQI